MLSFSILFDAVDIGILSFSLSLFLFIPDCCFFESYKLCSSFYFSLIGCSSDLLRYVGTKSTEFPEDFNVHFHLKKTHCEARVEKVCEGKNIDWATAEALAFGTLLHNGTLSLLFSTKSTLCIKSTIILANMLSRFHQK